LSLFCSGLAWSEDFEYRDVANVRVAVTDVRNNINYAMALAR